MRSIGGQLQSDVRSWTAPLGASVATGAALGSATLAYHTFKADLDGHVLAHAYALTLAAGVCGFTGLVAIAILLSSRFTPEAALDPLWMVFRAFVGVALLGLPVATGGCCTPWSWPSFLMASTFSVVVNGAWATFLVAFIRERGPNRVGMAARGN